MFQIITGLLFVLSFRDIEAALRCQNAAGADVDYWTGVKFPRPTGTRYTYTDSTLSQTEWTLGNDLAGTSGNPLSQTLAGLYSSSGYGYVMWNVRLGFCNKSFLNSSLFTHVHHTLAFALQDELPTTSGGSTSSAKAHAKGVLGFGPDGGFWLIHSVPKFPDRPAVSDYSGIASGQQINAQSFLCLSLDPSTIEQVSTLLGLEDLNIYSTTADIPASLAQQYRVTAALVTKKPSGAAKTSHTSISTEGGEPFVAFATSSTDIGGGDHTDQYLYEDLVANYFKSSLDVSTWPDESDFESSDCPTSGYIVQNVQGVSVKEAGLGWKNTVDHSKWCVTAKLAAADTTQVQIACVGDKNRDDKQLVRGGGTVCFADNSNIWGLYTSLIDLVESCR